MIKHSEPLSMVQAEEYVKKQKTSGADVVGFINKFTNLKPKEANELQKKLEDLKIASSYSINGNFPTKDVGVFSIYLIIRE